MLEKYQNFDKDRLTLDELVELSAFGRSIRSEYEALNIPEPEFVDIQLKALRREITVRNADALEAELRKINARLTQLATPEERREALRKQKAEIEEKLKGVA